jgi:hypothetical protein
MKNTILRLLAIFFSVSVANAQYAITTVAGTGVYGFTGSGGPASAANLSTTYYVYADNSGNIYIAMPHGVRMVDAAGIMHDIAGSGTVGYSGDGGPATAALLNNPQGVTKDTADNIYITEQAGHVIRKIDVAGGITTICGNGTAGYSGDGGPATAALVRGPAGITTDRNGNVFFADPANHCVRKISSAGIISTLAGNGTAGFSGDGGLAVLARLYACSDVAVDTFGNIFIADASNNRIRKIDASGIITTVAGSVSPGFTGDGGPATLARINSIGVTVDGQGRLFLAEANYHRIRMVSTSGIINTIAGNGTSGYLDDSCNALNGKLFRPGKVSLDTAGNIYISDIANLRVRKLVPDFIPYFTSGNVHTLYLCRNAPSYDLNSWLSVTDTNSGQGLSWSLLTAPLHGTCTGSYSTTITGAVTTPSGLFYTPATGYSGADTCRLVVTDCAGAKDTVSIFVYVYDPGAGAGVLSGADSVCVGAATTITASVPGGTWVAAGSNITVSAGLINGLAAGNDTVYYVVNNSCLNDTATHSISVRACTGAVAPAGTTTVVNALQLWPNPCTTAFNINVTGPETEELHIEITNVLGRKETTCSITTNTVKSIELSLPAGLYFITATTPSHTYTGKLIVVR